MKKRLLELFKKRNETDSKKEYYKCEKEICKILQSFVNKLSSIEDKVGYHVHFVDGCEIRSIEETCCNEELPEIIYCKDINGYEFEFDADWLDIDCKEYFNELKDKNILYKENVIKNVEKSLNKHKEELSKLKSLNYDDIQFD